MAPAVTSESSPCASVPHLRAETVPASPLNADSADHFASSGLILEAVSEMSDPAANTNCSNKNDVASLLNCVLSTASQTAVTPRDSDVISKLVTEGVDGASMSIQAVSTATQLANFKDQQQQAFDFVVKNNGKCRSGIIQTSSVGIKCEAGNTEPPTCNGRSLCISFSLAEDSSSCTQSTSQSNPVIASCLSKQHQSELPDVTSLMASDGSKLGEVFGCMNERTCDQQVSAVDQDMIKCTADKKVSVSAKQRELNVRTERLLRRLRRLQTREANSFVKEQLSKVVSFLRRLKSESTAEEVTENDQSFSSATNYRSMSTSQLVGLVRRMQSAECIASTSETVPVNANVGSELAATAGQLKGSLRHLERAVDSDATESSSGGESDEESMSGLKIHKDANEAGAACSVATDRTQARLTWSAERALIASRWTWLQAQVSDLEYRIRQQSNIYRQLRQLKGPAFIYIDPSTEGKSWADCSTPEFRSDNGSNSETASSLSDTEKSSVPGTDASCRSARCSALRACQQRRIIRSVATITKATNRKATALSTVRCTSCHAPTTPCTLCAGRVNHTVAVDPDQSVQDRIALLDPAFHPVLSFPADVMFSVCSAEADHNRRSIASCANTIHMREVTNANTGLTLRINKAHLKSLNSSTAGFGDHLIHFSSTQSCEKPFSVYRNTRFGPNTRRDISNSQIPLASMKILQGQSASKRALDTLRRKKRLSLVSKRLSMSSSAATLKSVGRPCRLGGSASSASLKDTFRRHSISGTGRTVYDINNVIIPYGAPSSAARLEVLKYKEIVTPKWRELSAEQHLDVMLSKRARRESSTSSRQSVSEPSVPMSSDVAKNSSTCITSTCADSETDSEVEDLSDEAFAARHLRHEIYEKKQFFPAQGQQRRSRSNRSESDHSITMLPEPTPSFDSSWCDNTVAHSSDSVINTHDPVSPILTPSNIHVDVDSNRCNSALLSALSRTAAFSFDPHVLSRFTEPAIGTEVIATALKSWPPRSFPLDDCDVEQLHQEQNSTDTVRHTRSSSVSSNPMSSSVCVSTAISCVSEASVVDSGWSVVVAPDTNGDTDNVTNQPIPNLVLKITKT